MSKENTTPQEVDYVVQLDGQHVPVQASNISEAIKKAKATVKAVKEIE